MPFLDGKPVIITKRNIDKHGNPISIKQVETKQVMDILNCIPVNYSIDRNHPIYIPGLYQIYNQDEISEDTFFADYDQGVLYFHPTMVGKSLKITYMGTGYILISSIRIYRYNKSDGSTGTLEASFEKIENLMKEILSGNVTADNIAAEVIGSRTDNDGHTYPSLSDRLNAIDEAINELKLINNTTTGTYEYRVYDRIETLGANATKVNIGIPEYDPKTDSLNVYLVGVKLYPGTSYILNESDRSVTCNNGEWLKNDTLYFEVIKRESRSAATNIYYNTYTNVFNVVQEVQSVTINIPQYDANSNTDILRVYLNGVRLLETIDFTLDKATKSIKCTDGTNWLTGEQLYFEVIKREEI